MKVSLHALAEPRGCVPRRGVTTAPPVRPNFKIDRPVAGGLPSSTTAPLRFVARASGAFAGPTVEWEMRRFWPEGVSAAIRRGPKPNFLAGIDAASEGLRSAAAEPKGRCSARAGVAARTTHHGSRPAPALGVRRITLSRSKVTSSEARNNAHAPTSRVWIETDGNLASRIKVFSRRSSVALMFHPPRIARLSASAIRWKSQPMLPSR
jgi:hypothetical protein